MKMQNKIFALDHLSSQQRLRGITAVSQLRSKRKRLRSAAAKIVERVRRKQRGIKPVEIKRTDNLAFLLELLTLELEERDVRRKNLYIKMAGFDVIKTFENYTFEDIQFPKTISPEQLKDVDFISQKENLIFYGGVGAGKTHLAIAIGLAACNAGFKTKFYRTASLVNALAEAQKSGNITRFLRQIDSFDLLICDEWGYVPVDTMGSKLLFQVIADCYERKSVIITTNLEFARWNEIFLDEKITAALLDRIIHHSHFLDFYERESRRLSDALINSKSLGGGKH